MNVERDSDGFAHIVALSGGKDSTAMALRLRELRPHVPFTYVCTPTGDELPSMRAHWDLLPQLLGRPLHELTEHDQTLHSLIKTWNALPNWRQRWCTRLLKIKVFERFYREAAPAFAYVGLRADEESRPGMIFSGDVEQLYPMRDWGWTIADVREYLSSREVSIPSRTDCARCPFQRLGEWWRLWRDHPELYESAVQDELRTGHTFRSPSRDTWPAELIALRQEFEAGRKPRGTEDHDAENTCRVCSM